MTTPSREEIDRALILADAENENSISSDKSFNSDGWAKIILARAYRAQEQKIAAMISDLQEMSAREDRVCEAVIRIGKERDEALKRVGELEEKLDGITLTAREGSVARIKSLEARLAAAEAVVEVAKTLIDGGGWATGRTLDRLVAALARHAEAVAKEPK